MLIKIFKKTKICITIIAQIKKKMINLVNKNKIKILKIYKNKKVINKKKDFNIFKTISRTLIMIVKLKKFNQKIFRKIIIIKINSK